MSERAATPRPDLRDDFPQTPARAAVVALVRGYGAVQRLMEPYFAEFGLTPPQFQLLTVINRLGADPPTQRRLARELYVSFPNVTVMLSRLEDAGLIRRRANSDDRREKLVELTAQGRALLRRIWRVHQAQLDRVVSGLTADEQVLLTRLLNKMIAAHPPTSPS
jgi:DNA-binding MarR family transcriptional regulator